MTEAVQFPDELRNWDATWSSTMPSHYPGYSLTYCYHPNGIKAAHEHCVEGIGDTAQEAADDAIAKAREYLRTKG